MRKATIVISLILVVGLAALTFAMKFYWGQIEVEVRHAKDLTVAHEKSLAPGGKIRLRRVSGASDLIVTDPKSPGLLLEADLSRETLATDPSAIGFARDVARRLFEMYPTERPIRWIQFNRISRPDDTTVPVFALTLAENGTLMPVDDRRGKGRK